MNDYMFLMHDDAPRDRANDDAHDWPRYIARLEQHGRFAGGSEIGMGASVRKSGEPGAISNHLVGYIRVRANSLKDVQKLLEGNPAFEAGSTIEIRELPRSG